ncbi:uncharacterized protein LOC111683512 [Lucilia cuprina]|uniref:uncharacterized protein LOC111683512 n=1 Tax=Lucilia cuprina TaxID=7375 RepID=UPI001F055A39|nr:uncharacterized protein LOC111683512 [Lucilia cuprina]
MILPHIIKYLLLSLIAVIFYQNLTAAISIKCGLEANCTITADSEICILEDTKDDVCIRKYPSKCHMDIVACKLGKNFTDFSAEYCTMDTFICEEGYERWTIFFGHENLIK